MTDRIIRVIVDTGDGNRQLIQLEDNLEGVEDQEKRTASSTKALGQAFRALVGAIAIREIGQAADAYTTISNRIRLVTDSQEELNTVQDEVFALAQRTRSDLTATADLYSRSARAVQEFGGSQRETLQFTEAINQTLQISGATAAEAAGSTIQFAQGLQAGALRGEELNSVLEGNNRLARILAKEFNVGIGELRRLGEAGELVGGRIFRAVINESAILRDEFGDIAPTIEQTFTTMRNFGTLVVGTFNEATGVTTGLVDIFSLTEEEAAELADTVRDLGLSFREFVEVATVAVLNFVETVGPRFGQIEAEIVKIIAAITRDEDLFREALAGQDEFDAEIDKITAKLDAEFEAIKRNNDERRRGLEARDADLDAQGEGSGRTPVDPAAAREAEKLLEQQQKLIASLRQQATATEIANREGREYSDVLAELKIETLAAANGNDAFGEEALLLTERLRKAKEETEALKLEERERNELLQDATDVINSVKTATELYAEEVARLQDLLDRGLIDQEVFDQAIDNIDLLDANTEDFFRRARENSQDILAEFFADGFDSLDDFAAAFASMLQQLASQALAAGIFDKLLGPSDGSGGAGLIGDFFGGLFGGRQFGGGVQGGQAVNTGEGGRFGAEAFIPNVGGTVVPINGPRGLGGGMSQPNVNITQVNALDQSEIVGSFQDGAGDQVLINRISVRRTAIRKALNL